MMVYTPYYQNSALDRHRMYQVSAAGNVALVNGVAASIAPGAPIDSALTRDGAFLYVEDSALGRVLFFRVQGNNLAPIGSVAGLPTTLQGIAAQ